jgi:hypothetical protein
MTQKVNLLNAGTAVALSAAVTLIGSMTAYAQPNVDVAKNEQFVKSLFAGPVAKTKTYACFVRTYDPEHLARHPLQKVRAMKLLVTAEQQPEADGPTYSFRLGLRYRAKSGNYDSSGGCRHSDVSAETNNEARLSAVSTATVAVSVSV